MEQYEFISWGTPHILALVFSALGIISILYFCMRLHKEGKMRVTRVLACFMWALFVVEGFWRFYQSPEGMGKFNLPLHLCSFMLLVCGLALWFRWCWACALTYFATLAACSQALITPDPANGYPSVEFYFFFVSHAVLLLMGFFVPLVLGWRARGWDDLKVVLILDAYLLVMIPLNLIFGTNYGYTNWAPPGSILEIMGPAPWYYLWLQLPVLGVLRLLLLPVRDKKEVE